MQYKKVRTIAFLGAGEYRPKKELSLVRAGDVLLYHIGTWNKDVPETGIFLTSGEMQSMEDAWFREAILEEYTEQERFQKDYLQQRENGSVEATLTRIKDQ